MLLDISEGRVFSPCEQFPAHFRVSMRGHRTPEPPARRVAAAQLAHQEQCRAGSLLP